MYGTELIAQVVIEELMTIPEVVTGVTRSRIRATAIIPPKFPAIQIAFERATYTPGAFGRRVLSDGPANSEEIQVAIKVITDGASTEPIIDIALAVFRHFDTLETERGSTDITFTAIAEVLPTSVADRDEHYRQLGPVLAAEITKGA